MKIPRRTLFVFLSVIALLLTACRGETTQPPQTSDSGSDSVTTPAATEAPAETNTEEPDTGDSNGTDAGNGDTTDTGEVPVDELGVPVDVPIVPGAYEIRSERENTRITYKVEGTIDDVVTFYQMELPTYNWTKMRGQDSAVGAMGSISRENENGDTIAILLSFNPNGNFVSVAIDILRSP